jgi:glycerol kinase
MAIDQGTTSSRVLLIDQDLKIIDSASREHEQISHHPGWCEHDPMVIYRNVVECQNEVIERNRGELVNCDGSSNVRAIGITNQRETTVAWNKHTGEPLHNAVVWLDTRTADIVARLNKEHGETAI